MSRTSLFAVALLALAGCGSSDSPVDSGTPGADSGTPGADSGTPGADSGTPGADSGAPSDAPAGTTATLHGVVTRSGTPMADGIGGLYVALFDMDPVIAMDAANVVAATYVESADMSSADASIPYEMTGIPPRAEPYFVIAFLDDNDTVTDPTMAAPDRGDLVSLEGFSSPQVTLDSPARVMLDIDLTTNLPF